VTTHSFLPDPVRIIGTGLIGGSLGLALRAAGVRIQLEDASPGTTALAVELGVGTVAEPDGPSPELVVVAAPPDVAADLVVQALRRFPGALVTDTASVKESVLVRVLDARANGTIGTGDLARYVGAHPMAGREVSGVIAARSDLFQGRPFVIVPHPEGEPRGVSTLKAIATEIGAVPTVLDAHGHDAAVAHVSHVPQILSSLVATTLTGTEDKAMGLSGQGLRDTTRIASSDPRLWVEILAGNAPAIAPVVREARDRLDGVVDALDALGGTPDPDAGARRTLASLIADGNRGVGRIPGKHGGGTDTFSTVRVLVPDRPGELGRLFTEMGSIGVNLEDLQLEHTLGQPVGVAHLSVRAGREDLLTSELRDRGWTVAEA
jgi:prephenate dehydrogenase